MSARRIAFITALALAAGCRSGPRPQASNVTRYDPAHDLGPLFQDVQLSGIFADSKTFVDARPLRPPAEIATRYASAGITGGGGGASCGRSWSSTSSCRGPWAKASGRMPRRPWRSTSARSGPC